MRPLTITERVILTSDNADIDSATHGIDTTMPHCGIVANANAREYRTVPYVLNLYFAGRAAAFALAVLLLCAICGGCVSTSTDVSPADVSPAGVATADAPSADDASADADTITVVSSFGAEDGNRAHFVDAYREYENVTGNTVIDLASVSNEEWKAGVAADFAAGREPDVLFYFTGADADGLVADGEFVTISEIRKFYPDYAKNMKDSMIPVSTRDGRQYAVPVNGYWEGMFVNTKVTEACGVEIPDGEYGWERFLDDCRAIRDAGYVPIACSLMEIPHYLFEYAIFNNGDIRGHASLPVSSGDAVGKIWAAGLMDIKRLYDEDLLPKNTTEIDDAAANALFAGGEAAFMIDGSWKVGWLRENAEDIGDYSVTFVPSKGGRGRTDIIGGLSMGYYITKKAWDDPEKRGACVGFVSAMTTDAVVSSFGALSVTALKNGTTPPEDADSLDMSALNMTKNCSSVVGAAQDLLTPAARAVLFGDVRYVVTGELTPEAAIDKCLAALSPIGG